MTDYQRGDIALCADKSGDFTGKPRPVLIIQRNAYIPLKNSVIVCPISTELSESPLRVRIHAHKNNGLLETSEVQTDKISAVRKARLGRVIGKLTELEMTKIAESLRDWMEI